MHFIRKLRRVSLLLSTLWAAQMFGKYQHSGWNGDFSYARYNWRGREWVIPTSCCED